MKMALCYNKTIEKTLSQLTEKTCRRQRLAGEPQWNESEHGRPSGYVLFRGIRLPFLFFAYIPCINCLEDTYEKSCRNYGKRQ